MYKGCYGSNRRLPTSVDQTLKTNDSTKTAKEAYEYREEGKKFGKNLKQWEDQFVV